MKKAEYVGGTRARGQFERTMTALFRAPKPKPAPKKQPKQKEKE